MPLPFPSSHPLNINDASWRDTVPDLRTLRFGLAPATQWTQSDADESVADAARAAEPEAARLCQQLEDKLLPSEPDGDAMGLDELRALASPTRSASPSAGGIERLAVRPDVRALTQRGGDPGSALGCAARSLREAGAGPFGVHTAMDAMAKHMQGAVQAVAQLDAGSLPASTSLDSSLHALAAVDAKVVAYDAEGQDVEAEEAKQQLPCRAEAALQRGQDLVAQVTASQEQRGSCEKLIRAMRTQTGREADAALVSLKRDAAKLEATGQMLSDGQSRARHMGVHAQATLKTARMRLEATDGINARAADKVKAGAVGYGLTQMVEECMKMQRRGAKARSDVKQAEHIAQRVDRHLAATEGGAELKRVKQCLAHLESVVQENIADVEALRSGAERVYAALFVVVGTIGVQQDDSRRKLRKGLHRLVELYLPLAFRDKVKTAKQSVFGTKEELTKAEHDHKVLKRKAVPNKAAKLAESMRELRALRHALVEAHGFEAAAKEHIDAFVAASDYEAICRELKSRSIVAREWKSANSYKPIRPWFAHMIQAATRALTSASQA